jgi:hypothetical protein
MYFYLLKPNGTRMRNTPSNTCTLKCTYVTLREEIDKYDWVGMRLLQFLKISIFTQHKPFDTRDIQFRM